MRGWWYQIWLVKIGGIKFGFFVDARFAFFQPFQVLDARSVWDFLQPSDLPKQWEEKNAAPEGGVRRFGKFYNAPSLRCLFAPAKLGPLRKLMFQVPSDGCYDVLCLKEGQVI